MAVRAFEYVVVFADAVKLHEPAFVLELGARNICAAFAAVRAVQLRHTPSAVVWFIQFRFPLS